MEKDKLIFEYKKMASGKYKVYISFMTAYSHDVDGEPEKVVNTYEEVMALREKQKRIAARSGYRFISRRL